MRSLLLTLLACFALTLPAQDAANASTSGPGIEKKVPPDFHQCNAVKTGEHLATVVQLDVTTDGLPENVALSQTSGNTCIDDAALEAVRKYKFRSAKKDGTPVRSHVRIKVDFARY